MEARAALAQCYMKLGRDSEAMELLSQYSNLNPQDQPTNKDSFHGQKANALQQLAYLHWKNGNRQNTLKFLTSFSNEAKNGISTYGRKLFDHARIAEGLAKGTIAIESHVEMVLNSRENIYDLVEWKNLKDKK